jgi:uncharacterized protein YndB with AHSA1/START domain
MIVHKTVHVSRPPDVAFKIFVEELAQWWPSKTHSFLGAEENPTPMIEPYVGGRVLERGAGGSEHVIGDVVAYEPGSLISYTWNHENNAGSTLLEIRFTAEGSGTRVDLRHSGWEALADETKAAGYAEGWDTVLGFYVAHADAR